MLEYNYFRSLSFIIIDFISLAFHRRYHEEPKLPIKNRQFMSYMRRGVTEKTIPNEL